MSPSGHTVGVAKVSALAHGEPVLSGGHGSHSTHDWSFGVNEMAQPSFNVLFVETPRIGVMQSPLVVGLRQTWADAMDLIKPITTLGIPHATLESKCPYHDDGLWSKPEGAVLTSATMRKVIEGHNEGYIHHHLTHDKHVPHSHPPMWEPPPGWFVIGCNLLCYALLLNSANRGK